VRRPLLAVFSLLICAGAQAGQAPSATAQARAMDVTQIRAAALDTQNRCYRLIHHDTWAFRDCVAELLARPRLASDWRLGVAYFGWVGALNSLRVGMAGAEETANEFLPQFRRLQKKLKVDDATLCTSIEGDCAVRTARMRQTEASLAQAPTRAARPRSSDADGHHH
jgi:hypothetical protein